MKLLVDMNLSPRWIDFLEGAGFKVTHWSTTGAAGATDDAIMAHARANDFVVLTHDLDFGAILAATHGHKPSVVQVRASNVSPEAIGLALVAALKQVSQDLEAGALVTVDPGRARLRLLPL